MIKSGARRHCWDWHNEQVLATWLGKKNTYSWHFAESHLVVKFWTKSLFYLCDPPSLGLRFEGHTTNSPRPFSWWDRHLWRGQLQLCWCQYKGHVRFAQGLVLISLCRTENKEQLILLIVYHRRYQDFKLNWTLYLHFLDFRWGVKLKIHDLTKLGRCALIEDTPSNLPYLAMNWYKRSLGLAEPLPMHDRYLIDSWPAWHMLGMKSNTRNLGMNSHSFLFSNLPHQTR